MLLAKAPAPVLEQPSPHVPSGKPALAQLIDSLAMVEALDITQVYPGHGEPFGDHRQVIWRQRARLELRLTQTADLIAAGHRTVAALMAQLYSAQSTQFNLAGLWMLTAYLDFLETTGRITSAAAPNGVRFYQQREKSP